MKKCEFFKKRVTFLGNLILESGHAISPDKEAAIRDWKTPVTVTQLRSFLCTCNFLKRFTHHLSETAAPLYLASGKQTLTWNPECEAAFQAVKCIMLSSSTLRHVDSNKPFVLVTDASKYAVASVLLQEDDDGIERPVGYFSRKMDSHELRYMVYDIELLDVVSSMK